MGGFNIDMRWWRNVADIGCLDYRGSGPCDLGETIIQDSQRKRGTLLLRNPELRRQGSRRASDLRWSKREKG
ncbi:MAG: hypothetical protein COW41_08910 [Deltaproteobacteria bacterium CG17_big_fil_post_rev_8_21_14_2_50_51_6]|nr:MAG: hypothetical protein COW41_08910 [Deltaproteobacteria bacterium CG17_big_fil_post_rev_8_21_14_2_50_51_6]